MLKVKNRNKPRGKTNRNYTSSYSLSWVYFK